MMKKTLLLIMGVLLSLSASAYTCVSFKAGDPSILMQKKRISYEIDWDHARVTNHDNLLFPQYLKKRGDDFVADWPEDRAKAEKYFTVRFNRKSDYLKISDDGKSGELKMILRIATIDVGDGASGFNPWASSKAGGTIIDGTIEFYNEQGQLTCILNIIEAKGTSSPSETIRYGLTLMEIAGDIHDFIDDEVKKGKVQPTPIAGAAAVTTAAPAAAATTAATVTTAAAAPVVTTTAATTAAAAPAAASSASRRSVGRGTAAATTAAAPAVTTAAPTPTAAAASSASSAMGGEARVTLKNGSVIIGKVKAFDPTTSITIAVAGLTTTIPMSEVAHVESSEGGVTTPMAVVQTTEEAVSSAQVVVSAGDALGNRKQIVTDNGQYPSTLTINVNGQQLRMVLVRGGRMNMGYDGDGSRKMMSEPVHEVGVTSFYISEQPISAEIASQMVNDVEGRGSEPAQFREFSDAQKLVSVFAQKTGKPYRLPTEAEWEYAASGDQQNAIFNIGRYTYYEWTSDYHGEFPDDRAVITDPTGPSSGKQHQVRSFNGKKGKYDRSNKVDEDDAYVGLVRLVVKAKDR